AIRAFCVEEDARLRMYVAGLDQAALMEPLGKGSCPRGLILAPVVDHRTQHRSELARDFTECGHSPGDLHRLEMPHLPSRAAASPGRDAATAGGRSSKMRLMTASPTPGARVLMTGIAFGESPRWHDGRLWFCDWSAEEIIALDPDGGSEVVARVHSFPFSI